MKTFRTISVHDAQTLLGKTGTQLVDIRDEFAFNEGHIDNAAHIDNSNVDRFIAGANKSAPLIVCCYHGISSQSVAQFFIEQGFDEVYSLNGGFEEWKITRSYVKS